MKDIASSRLKVLGVVSLIASSFPDALMLVNCLFLRGLTSKSLFFSSLIELIAALAPDTVKK